MPSSCIDFLPSRLPIEITGVLPPYILRNLIFRTGHELQSEFFRFARQGFERPLFDLIIVLFLADVGVVDAALQHSVDQERQFVCRGDDSLRFSDAGTETATKSAKRAFAAKQALGVQAKNSSSAADRLTCSAFEQTAPGDFVIGAQAEPRDEMFFCRPWTHVDADLGNQTQSCRFANAIDPRQIRAADSKRFFSNVELYLIPLFPYDPLPGGSEAAIGFTFQTANMLRDLLIAFGDLLLIMVERIQRLPQRKEMFGAVIAFKSLLDSRLIRLSSIPQGC